MYKKALVPVAFMLFSQIAHAAVNLPKVSCLPSRTVDIQHGSYKRIIAKGPFTPVLQPNDQTELAYPSIFLRVDPQWLEKYITLEEQERSTQVLSDARSIKDQIIEKIKSGAEGVFKELHEIPSAPPEQLEEGTNCIEYQPTSPLTTVEVGHRKIEIRKADTTVLIYGPEEHFFLPLGATLTKIRNEQYDSATRQVVSNDKFSLLAGVGYKLGDYHTKYPSVDDKDWGYLGNVSVSFLVRLPIGDRTWAAGPAVSYRLAEHGPLQDVDIFIGALRAKGDGQGTKAVTSFTLGVMMPVSKASGSSH